MKSPPWKSSGLCFWKDSLHGRKLFWGGVLLGVPVRGFLAINGNKVLVGVRCAMMCYDSWS